MEEMQGLAGQMGGMGAGSKIDPMVALNEVVAMLEQGATPEELLQMGIPREVIEAALDMLMGQNSQPVQEGLAGMHMDPAMMGM